MYTLRYVMLAAPLGYFGMQLAIAHDEPALYGILAGLLTASVVASTAFWIWARLRLAAAIAAGQRTVPAG